MSRTTPVAAARGLTKSFGRARALDGLDLAVHAGEIHGFLGPNGAGKSTTIRILLGLVRADGGQVELFGADPWRDAARLHGRLAYVAGDVALWPGLTGGQCLDVIGSTHGRVDERRRAELIDRFALDPTKRIRDYSKGNRQKVALVAALAADADLLVLDEPTSGLDPLMEQTFRDCVRERRRSGAAVLLSSHLLDEVEALADRVTIVRTGRTVTTGSLADLRRHTRTSVHAVTVQPVQNLHRAEGVTDYACEHLDGHFDVRFTIDADHLDATIGRLHTAGIRTLTVTPPSLDTLFRHAYGDGGQSEAAR